MKKFEYTVSEKFDGSSLDFFLKSSAGFSNKIIGSLRNSQGNIFINSQSARMIDKVNAGDKILILLEEKTKAPPLWEMPLDIIFEDERILVINKPAGISLHPTFKHPDKTLCNAVAFYLSEKSGEPEVARAIGRLDKVTSGVMIFAKDKITAALLNGNLEKVYNAIATGETPPKGTINAPIYRPDESKTLRAAGKGDEAITHYKAIKFFKDKTLLEIKTETGRTHQIRVHLSYIGHPLLGDTMYGAPQTENLKRAALHCSKVTLINPQTNEQETFIAPLPDDMKKELEKNQKRLDKQGAVC